jgi:hypothetical protein
MLTDVVAGSKLDNTGEACTSTWLLVKRGATSIARGASVTLQTRQLYEKLKFREPLPCACLVDTEHKCPCSFGAGLH